MSSAKELLRRIETCELPHPAYLTLFNFLIQRIEFALEGFASRIEWVIGPSRVGKSMLINSLARRYPESRVNGIRQVPVLVVRIPSNISPKLLPKKVLAALGVPLRDKTSGELDERMYAQLRLAGTRVIIFEEISHMVEVGARVPPRAAADWYKDLADVLDVTILMFGVPRLERLFDCNEQLSNRASAKREFLPYDFRGSDEQMAYASCVRTYADLFRDAGWPIELPFQELVTQTYLLDGGLIGILSRFMQELASQMAYESPRPLTLDDCRSAARAIRSAGHPDFPAFERSDVTPVELNLAHAHVLETNGMSVRPIAAPQGAG